MTEHDREAVKRQVDELLTNAGYVYATVYDGSMWCLWMNNHAEKGGVYVIYPTKYKSTLEDKEAAEFEIFTAILKELADNCP